jgi:ribosomal-protein-alanine N-acetyltransferase
MLKFVAKDGSEFIIREPKIGDAKSCLDYINALVVEGAPIIITKVTTLKEERKWLRRQIEDIKKKRNVTLIAEKNGEIVSICQLWRRTYRMSHVADFGIGVKRKYRRIGIADAISREVIKRGKEKGIEIVRSWVFEDNEPSKALHKKLGFVRDAILKDEIKYGRNYKDAFLMSLYLKK